MNIKDFIRTIPDYPKSGIQFRDITTLLADPEGFRGAVDALVALHKGAKFQAVAGIEARGFILGGAVAHQLGLGFIPVRKKGKLPHHVIGRDYQLEYGVDTMEVHADAMGVAELTLTVPALGRGMFGSTGKEIRYQSSAPLPKPLSDS